MKYYLAPMEGITGYIYRNSYEKFFHNIDKYFTPFIVTNKSRSLKTKELRDVLPENNKGAIRTFYFITKAQFSYCFVFPTCRTDGSSPPADMMVAPNDRASMGIARRGALWGCDKSVQKVCRKR